jgi:hypothetical protein
MNFEHPDLRADAGAAAFVKHELVQVVFASDAGAIASREGANHYRPGDALVTGTRGERWSVSRDRFEARYEPVPPLLPGAPGNYRSRPLPVLARQVPEDFTVHRCVGGDLLHGRAGDWLLQYAPGDWGVVGAAKFRQVYVRLARTG